MNLIRIFHYRQNSEQPATLLYNGSRIISMTKMFIRNIVANSYFTAAPVRLFLIQPTLRRISCWKCGKEHSHCEQGSKCVATQDPSKINYFELLGQKISYNIDATTLVSNYHKLQIQYHPDKHNNESEVMCFN